MKILAVSGTRADWGLLQPVLTLLRDDPRFTLEILITGQHLMSNINSAEAIEAAGFNIDYRISMELTREVNDANLCGATGRVVDGVGAALLEGKPDLLLVLGDRYEILGATTAALLSKIPVAHIAGGDVTEGAFDDSIRHAITKMSSLHFTTTEKAARRVRQMGEPAAKVFCTGSPGIDQMAAVRPIPRAEFFESLGLTPQQKNFIITLHPATLSTSNLSMAGAMLKALEPLSKIGLIFTGSNADPGAEEIEEMIRAWVKGRTHAVFHTSLGSKRYFSALQHCDIVLGNSSSGLYEAPSYGIPTVNIGDRQAGRIRAASVIDCAPEATAIQKAIEIALSKHWANTVNPYGDGRAATRIVSLLANVTNPAGLIRKSFEDLEYD